MKLLYIYTTPDCPACAELKKMLFNEKISFFERDVEQHETAFVQIINSTGLDYVPVIEVRDTSPQTTSFLVPERDFKDVESGFQLVKSKLRAG